MANRDEDMNDSLVEESQLNAESTTISSKAESKQLVERDGEMGYLKNNGFNPMTNFSVECVGYVVESIGSTSANGFLFRVIPKDFVSTDCFN